MIILYFGKNRDDCGFRNDDDIRNVGDSKNVGDHCRDAINRVSTMDPSPTWISNETMVKNRKYAESSKKPKITWNTHC